MTQGCQDFCFPLELASIIIGLKGIFLNRNRHIQIFVDGAINCAHPPLSEDVEDAISMIEKVSVFKRHGL